MCQVCGIHWNLQHYSNLTGIPNGTLICPRIDLAACWGTNRRSAHRGVSGPLEINRDWESDSLSDQRSFRRGKKEARV